MKNTFIPSDKLLKPKIKEKWYIIDAKDKCLGRISTQVSNLLRGKNKNIFTPWQTIGDYIIIINANQVKVTGNKSTQKLYFRHSRFPGGEKYESFHALQSRFPERIFEKAVKGMLPKNRLGRKLFRRLKIYCGASHPHLAQKPELLHLE
uniref:50S ribosomal protein L13 n=1 Tax=Dictyotopsis propagulifera TaxID=670095 RepID=UPI002E79605F|nr:50S ribosomal protein L13 [Dictyotopsis propagulifera]WAM63133.1 50S ribosomal protein L13 [Dictyotopsis propagulifera]